MSLTFGIVSAAMRPPRSTVPDDRAIVLSREHTACRWLSYEEAARLLAWDSNKTALWELNARVGRGERAAT